MKTFYRILICVAALATMSALVSCNKDKNGKDSDVTFKVPAQKTNAQKFVFTETAEKIVYEDSSVNGEVQSIDNTAEGRSIIVVKERSKAAGDFVTVISSFTYTDGKWVIKGLGTIELKDGGKVAFTDADNNTIEVPATVVEPLTGTAADNLCRLWKIESTAFVAKGGQLSNAGVGTTFTGKDASSAQAIANYFKNNSDGKINITEDLSGYDIKTIEVTDGGSLVIEFANEPSFVAEIKNFKAGEFKYELVAGNGNDVINAEANGKVEFAGTADSPRCRFTIIGKIVNGSTTYTTNIEFVLVKA